MRPAGFEPAELKRASSLVWHTGLAVYVPLRLGRSVTASPARTAATICSCLREFLGATMPTMNYGNMNWLAVFCAGLAYWLLGAIWYSAVFSKMWRSAVEEHGVKIGPPNQGGMGIKLIVTLVCNLIMALVLARVIHQVGHHHMDLLRGLKIGAGVGLGFCATALTMTYVWQSPPRRLWAIDAGYHIVGCTIMGAILAIWR